MALTKQRVNPNSCDSVRMEGIADESLKMSKNDNRIMVTLSDFALRNLTLWATLHNKPKATYAAQILESRIEANAKLIEELIQAEAKHRGVTVAELEAEWLGTNEED